MFFIYFYRKFLCIIFEMFHSSLMYSGVSSFNNFIHELSVDSDTSSSDYSSGEEDNDAGMYPVSPSAHSSRASRSSTSAKYDRRRIGWIRYLFLWILFPIKFMLGIPYRAFRYSCCGSQSYSPPVSNHSTNVSSIKRVQSLMDHIVHRTTDRRRGVVEVSSKFTLSNLFFYYCHLCPLNFVSFPLCPLNFKICHFAA